MGTSDDKKKVDRVTRLLETLRELQAKQYEVTEEIRKILAGDAAIGDLMRQASDAWLRIWSGRYRSKYAWDGAKDSAAAKRLVATFDLEDLAARMQAFVEDNDPFYAHARHPFALFARNVNRYVPIAEVSRQPNLCPHDPACARLSECVARTVEEARALRSRRG